MNANELYSKAANCYTLNSFDEAKKLALKALQKDKKHSASLNLLGTIAFENSDFAQAKLFFDKAIASCKTNSLAFNNLGKLYTKTKEFALAKEAFLQSINISPNLIDPYFNIACLLLEEKEYLESKNYFLKTIELDSSFANAYLSLGIIEKELKNYENALMYLTLAIKQNPNYAQAYTNLAMCLFDLEQIDRAKAASLKAIEINPNLAICYSNFSIILNACNELQNSAKCLQKAYELEPQNDKIATNFALTLLALNDYENGLKLLKRRNISRLICDKPLWNGEVLEGKTIVVYAEQGLGDTINFARFLSKLNAKKIYFIPQDLLLNLFKNSSINAEIIQRDKFLASNIEFDYHCALFDIMDICKIYMPLPNVNFININKQKKDFFNAFLPKQKLKIGIVWQGNKSHINDKLRSCALDYFKEIAKLNNIALISLQKDIDTQEVELFSSEYGLLNFANSLEDFEDTAALIDCVDMVISIDTSVAHIAATINKPTWLLLPLCPDWRWHYNNASWYDSIRLFKKKEIYTWNSVFDNVICELKKIEL